MPKKDIVVLFQICFRVRHGWRIIDKKSGHCVHIPREIKELQIDFAFYRLFNYLAQIDGNLITSGFAVSQSSQVCSGDREPLAADLDS